RSSRRSSEGDRRTLRRGQFRRSETGGSRLGVEPRSGHARPTGRDRRQRPRRDDVGQPRHGHRQVPVQDQHPAPRDDGLGGHAHRRGEGAAGMTRRLRPESGQALVVSVVFMVVLMGGVALTLDVGSWFREHRQAQTTADAAALSAAQMLPAADTTWAKDEAVSYAGKNGGGIDAANGITFTKDSSGPTYDTRGVRVTRPAPGVFSRLVSVHS